VDFKIKTEMFLAIAKPANIHTSHILIPISNFIKLKRNCFHTFTKKHGSFSNTLPGNESGTPLFFGFSQTAV
jgi:hypothetical protein